MCVSGDQVVDDFSVDVGQPEVATTVAECQLLVFDAHQVQDRLADDRGLVLADIQAPDLRRNG